MAGELLADIAGAVTEPIADLLGQLGSLVCIRRQIKDLAPNNMQSPLGGWKTIDNAGSLRAKLVRSSKDTIEPLGGETDPVFATNCYVDGVVDVKPDDGLLVLEGEFKGAAFRVLTSDPIGGITTRLRMRAVNEKFGWGD